MSDFSDGYGGSYTRPDAGTAPTLSFRTAQSDGGDGGGSNTGPRWGLFAAVPTATNTDKQAILAACTHIFGSSGTDNGSASVTSSAGLYVWIAVLAAAVDGGAVTMTDASSNDIAPDFSGAGLSGAGSQTSGTHLTVTDGSARLWWLFRSDYPHPYPTPYEIHIG